jgi:hypothetical protein
MLTLALSCAKASMDRNAPAPAMPVAAAPALMIWRRVRWVESFMGISLGWLIAIYFDHTWLYPQESI